VLGGGMKRLDFGVISALGVGALLRYGFGTSWLFAILSGLSVFVLVPLLILFAVHMRVLYVMWLFKRAIRKGRFLH
jgi:hypothetical protein